MTGKTIEVINTDAEGPIRPMTCPRLDHFGLSVGAEAELDDDPRARQGVAGATTAVDIIDKQVDDHGMLAITSIYVALPAADDGRDPVVGLQGTAEGDRA